VYLKNLETQSMTLLNSKEKEIFSTMKTEDYLEKDLQKTEKLSEFCVLEGISDPKCTQKLKGSQACYIESCKHCCFVTLNGHTACMNKCDAMRDLIGS